MRKEGKGWAGTLAPSGTFWHRFFKVFLERGFSEILLKLGAKRCQGATLSWDHSDSNSNFLTKWLASEERKGVLDCGVK